MNLEGLRPHLQWVPVCAGISRDPLTQEGAPPPLFIPKVAFFVPYMHYFIECCFKTKKKTLMQVVQLRLQVRKLELGDVK